MKFIGGQKKGLKMHYKIEQMPLLFGRSKCNDISFESDKKMSRYQCRFDYKGHKWVLSDGREQQQPSINGTWILCIDEQKLGNED